MEVIGVFLGLGLLALLLIVPIFTFIAYARTNDLRIQVDVLKKRLKALEGRPARPAPETAAVPEPAATPAPAPSPAAEKIVLPAPTPAPVAREAAPLPPKPDPLPPRPESPDLATNLGPKILVGFGALAVFAALAFFVKYAWDNDWVGPTGRVLFGLVVSLGLVTFGLRLFGREYRPLGQGLAGAGFAGLYVSTFGAHGFYDLIPREAAGLFLVLITACAIAIAVRLDARLLAALAWIGAYLTPILLSTGKDQAVALFGYLTLLGIGAVVIRKRKGWKETGPLALLGTCVLYGAWAAEFYGRARFGVAALGLLVLMAVFTEIVPAVTLLLGSVALIGLSVDLDRPALMTGVLVLFAALAIASRPRFAFAETVGVLTSWIFIAIWLADHFAPERVGDALLLAVTTSGVYFLALAVRGLLQGLAVGGAGVATHLVSAGLVWSVLFRAFYDTNPSLLGLLSVALAFVCLGLGLGLARQEDRDVLHVRTMLGLAAGFVTIAIPVQLGLHGITLAWAVEGLVLLGLGVRFASNLTRAAGYAVLGTTVLRLFVRHLPLHDDLFTPFLNASFGTWLFVIATLGAGMLVAREPWRDGDPLERVMRPLLATTALLLFFGLTTGETQALFDQQARTASAAGLDDAAQRARLTGGLAISVLWSVFAIALLASGLIARSRALFWTSYALFALAGLKVVFVDLAELHTLYRILSFLALGVLLMLGAYVNIRFSDRLAPKAAA